MYAIRVCSAARICTYTPIQDPLTAPTLRVRIVQTVHLVPEHLRAPPLHGVREDDQTKYLCARAKSSIINRHPGKEAPQSVAAISYTHITSPHVDTIFKGAWDPWKTILRASYASQCNIVLDTRNSL
jgi:hypothetical protein